MQRDEFRCTSCLDKTKTLHVHHLDYISGNEPWEYENNYLITLCHDCHAEITEERPHLESIIIKHFRLKQKNRYAQMMVAEVFEEFNDLESLFFLLSMLREEEDNIIDHLRLMWAKQKEETYKRAVEHGIDIGF